jgi:maltose O-acetyltransferase
MRKLIALCHEEVGWGNIPVRLRIAQSLAACLPYLSGKRLRTVLYRLGGVQIGTNSIIMGPLRIWGCGKLKIGNGAVINSPCDFNIDGDITIGDRVTIGNGVLVMTAVHRIGGHGRRAGHLTNPQPVSICDGAWIAANATILPGVVIGAGSIVAAGAVVTKDVAPDTLVAGVPARLVRELPPKPENREADSIPAPD